MARTLTAIVTALWLAPLLGWRIGVLLAAASVRSPGTQITAAERGMGEGMVLLAGGGLAGIAIFVATIALVYAYLPPRSLRLLQVTDAIAIACLAAWGIAAEAAIRQHDPPTYDGFRARLDIEVRTPKASAESTPRFDVHMVGGYAEENQLIQLIREDDGYFIVPIEVRIISVHDWLVEVRHVYPGRLGWPYRFRLPLRDFPKGNLPWSDWIEPILVPEWHSVRADDVTIRYRWVLTPVGQVRVYQP